jgi:hypothetical protein
MSIIGSIIVSHKSDFDSEAYFVSSVIFGVVRIQLDKDDEKMNPFSQDWQSFAESHIRQLAVQGSQPC